MDAQNFLQSRDVVEKSVLIRKESSASPQTVPVRRNPNSNSFTEVDENEKGPSEIKKEEEIKCRRNQLIQKIGTLGNGTKVELLSRPGQLIDIAKVISLSVSRKPLNVNTYEWLGFDQNRLVLVSEFRFDSSVNSRNKEELVNFERTVKKFVEDLKVRSFPTDNFLTQYAFFHCCRQKRAKFSLDLVMGQVVYIYILIINKL